VGDFALVLNDDNGNLLNQCFFSVVGEGVHSVLKKRHLDVKLDKKVYQAGDTIEIQINAPYVGAGLLTIERDKVHAYKWFKADSTTSVQTITIPSDFQGNGYLNVSFVRSWDSDEIYTNPLSYAVLPFSVSNKPQTVRVDLNVPEFVRAGEELTIQYSTDQPAKIILFAVDEGLLLVDGYQVPDPLAYFFRKSALRVKTSQIADLILPKKEGKRELSATGGDRRSKLLAMNFNPFKRKTEKAVTFWFGILDSDSTPKTVRCQMPHSFNGSLRIMAVAASENKVGNEVKNIEVQSYFPIQPNVPTFVAPGDRLTVTATITNGLKNDDQATPTTVTLEASPEFVILGSAEENLMIPPGQERQVSFKIMAEKRIGGAKLTFTAKQGDKESKVHSSVTVRPPSVYQTHLISGYENSSIKTIHPSRRLYPEQRMLEASASTNPFILAQGLQSYLDHLSGDSTEQVVCQAFAQHVMARHSFLQVNSEVDERKFKKSLQILRERQFSCGGFSEWSGRVGFEASPFASVLAMDYLTEAKLDGFAVPEDVFNGGIHYLENLAKQDVTSLSEARMQAYAIYLLTRNGVVTSNYLTNLQLYLMANHKMAWRKDLTSVYMGATHKLLQSIPQADLLISSYRLQDFSQNKNFVDDSLIDDAQYVNLLARHFPERLQTIKGDALMALVQGIAGDQLNTRLAAYSIQALFPFSQTRSNNALKICELREDHQEKTLTSSHPSYLKVNFDAEAKGLRFHNPEKQTYFYQVNQTGFDRSDLKQPIKNGLEIYREYRDHKDNPIQSTQLGNQIEAHIKMRILNPPSIKHVAIVDLLPGGFDIVPDSVHAPDCEYVDVREDRIIFYCSHLSSPSEVSYRLQAVNKGEYTVPPIFAQAMDHPKIQAQGVSSRITIH
jgi:alpha-2-macroglobulin